MLRQRHKHTIAGGFCDGHWAAGGGGGGSALRPPLPPPHASATTACGAGASGRRCHLGACLHQRPAEGVGAWQAGRHGGVLVADVEASAPVAVVSRHLGDDALARLEQPRMQFGHAKCLLYAHGPRDLVYKRIQAQARTERQNGAGPWPLAAKPPPGSGRTSCNPL